MKGYLRCDVEADWQRSYILIIARNESLITNPLQIYRYPDIGYTVLLSYTLYSLHIIPQKLGESMREVLDDLPATKLYTSIFENGSVTKPLLKAGPLAAKNA